MQASTHVTPTRPENTRRAPRRVAIVLAVLIAAALLLPLTANAAVSAFAAHDHGTLDIVVDGETLDLDQERYHDLHPQFHIHEGSGNLWHHHPYDVASIVDFEPMSLTEAFRALEMEATATTFTLDGTTYDDSDPGTSVSITVDGQAVDPDQTTITDDLEIVVEIDTDT